ncbi:MAG: prohibitin family protein [Deferribacterales bacterium]
MAENNNYKNSQRLAFLGSSFFIIALIVAMGAFASYKIIPAGYRGVLLTFGKPSDVVLGEGLKFKIPFAQKIILIDTKIKKGQIDTSAASKDLQDVTATMAVNYHVNPEQVDVLYKTIGLDFESRVIDPSVREVMKAVTAKYTASELITRREDVKNNIKMLLKERLAAFSIIVDDFSIVDFSFSKVFTDAIEAKQTAEQLAIKAQRDLERIKIEAEQKIAQAQAEAESLRLQKTNVTTELIRLREIEMQSKAIEKWDGHLPQYTGGAMPFINVDRLNK